MPFIDCVSHARHAIPMYCMSCHAWRTPALRRFLSVRNMVDIVALLRRRRRSNRSDRGSAALTSGGGLCHQEYSSEWGFAAFFWAAGVRTSRVVRHSIAFYIPLALFLSLAFALSPLYVERTRGCLSGKAPGAFVIAPRG